MVMHASKLPRLSDGFHDRNEAHPYQTSVDKYPSKSHNSGGTNSDHSSSNRERDREKSQLHPQQQQQHREMPASGLRHTTASPSTGGSRPGSESGSPRSYRNKSSYLQRQRDRQQRGSSTSPAENTFNHQAVVHPAVAHPAVAHPAVAHPAATNSHPPSDPHSSHEKNIKTILAKANEWTEHVSSSKKKYYYNCKTEVSQWEKPKEWVERERLKRMVNANESLKAKDSPKPVQAADSSHAKASNEKHSSDSSNRDRPTSHQHQSQQHSAERHESSHTTSSSSRQQHDSYSASSRQHDRSSTNASSSSASSSRSSTTGSSAGRSSTTSSSAGRPSTTSSSAGRPSTTSSSAGRPSTTSSSAGRPSTTSSSAGRPSTTTTTTSSSSSGSSGSTGCNNNSGSHGHARNTPTQSPHGRSQYHHYSDRQSHGNRTERTEHEGSKDLKSPLPSPGSAGPSPGNSVLSLATDMYGRLKSLVPPPAGAKNDKSESPKVQGTPSPGPGIVSPRLTPKPHSQHNQHSHSLHPPSSAQRLFPASHSPSLDKNASSHHQGSQQTHHGDKTDSAHDRLSNQSPMSIDSVSDLSSPGHSSTSHPTLPSPRAQTTPVSQAHTSQSQSTTQQQASSSSSSQGSSAHTATTVTTSTAQSAGSRQDKEQSQAKLNDDDSRPPQASPTLSRKSLSPTHSVSSQSGSVTPHKSPAAIAAALANAPLKPITATISPSLVQYFDEGLTRHASNWPAEHAERQAHRLNEESHVLGVEYSSQISVDLKFARSLVRASEIQATLQEQRILFLRQQAKDLEKLKSENAYMT